MFLQEFLKAADDVKKLKTTPDNDALLELYGNFKQATVGDCNTSEYTDRHTHRGREREREREHVQGLSME